MDYSKEHTRYHISSDESQSSALMIRNYEFRKMKHSDIFCKINPLKEKE